MVIERNEIEMVWLQFDQGDKSKNGDRTIHHGMSWGTLDFFPNTWIIEAALHYRFKASKSKFWQNQTLRNSYACYMFAMLWYHLFIDIRHQTHWWNYSSINMCERFSLAIKIVSPTIAKNSSTIFWVISQWNRSNKASDFSNFSTFRFWRNLHWPSPCHPSCCWRCCAASGQRPARATRATAMDGQGWVSDKVTCVYVHVL